MQGVASYNSIFTNGPETIAFGPGDFNGDGKMDFACTNGTNRITTMIGNGNGGFIATSVYTVNTNQVRQVIAKRLERRWQIRFSGVDYVFRSVCIIGEWEWVF